MPDVESLLGEIAALRGMVAERDARLAELTGLEVQLKAARLEIEQLLHRHIFLELHVKVEKGWTSDPRKLKELGL